MLKVIKWNMRKIRSFYSYGNTKFNINDKYIIFSKNVFYNRNTQTIYGSDFTKIEDDQRLFNRENLYLILKKSW